MPVDDALREQARPEKGSKAMRAENAPVSVHGDPELRAFQSVEPDENPSPADEDAQSPMDAGSRMPKLKEEPVMTAKPNIETKTNFDASDLLAILPFL